MKRREILEVYFMGHDAQLIMEVEDERKVEKKESKFTLKYLVVFVCLFLPVFFLLREKIVGPSQVEMLYRRFKVWVWSSGGKNQFWNYLY